MIYKAV